MFCKYCGIETLAGDNCQCCGNGLERNLGKLMAIDKFSDPGISVIGSFGKDEQVIFSYNRRGFDMNGNSSRGPAINGEISLNIVRGKLWQFQYCDFEQYNNLGLYSAETFISFLLSKALK